MRRPTSFPPPRAPARLSPAGLRRRPPSPLRSGKHSNPHFFPSAVPSSSSFSCSSSPVSSIAATLTIRFHLLRRVPSSSTSIFNRQHFIFFTTGHPPISSISGDRPHTTSTSTAIISGTGPQRHRSIETPIPSQPFFTSSDRHALLRSSQLPPHILPIAFVLLTPLPPHFSRPLSSSSPQQPATVPITSAHPNQCLRFHLHSTHRCHLLQAPHTRGHIPFQHFHLHQPLPHPCFIFSEPFLPLLQPILFLHRDTSGRRLCSIFPIADHSPATTLSRFPCSLAAHIRPNQQKVKKESEPN